MDISLYHAGALFFGSVTIFNIYSARKYGESYLPAVVGIMMLISLILFIVVPWQYGYVALLLTMLYSIANYRKSYSINKAKMRRFIGDSQNTEPLKPVDYFTGWKLLHRLNKNYGPRKASLIYSAIMWIIGILLISICSHLWPDIFSNTRYIAYIMTIIMFGFYWQNKKLLEDLDSGNLQQVEKK